MVARSLLFRKGTKNDGQLKGKWMRYSVFSVVQVYPERPFQFFLTIFVVFFPGVDCTTFPLGPMTSVLLVVFVVETSRR